MARKKKTFKLKIIEIFTILILTIGLGLSFMFYSRSTEIILDLSDHQAKEVASKIIERTTNYIGTPATQTRALANWVSDPNIISIHTDLWKYTWEQLMVFPQIQSMFVAGTDGSYVQVRREPRLATRYIDRTRKTPSEKWLYRNTDYTPLNSISKVPTFDPRTRPWYKNTQAEKKIYWTDVYVFTTAQTPGISASYPVVDKKGDLVAVTTVNIPLHSLSEFLGQQKVTNNAVILITNEKNEIIATSMGTSTSKIDKKTGLRRLSSVSELPEQWITDAYNTYRQKTLIRQQNGTKQHNSWFVGATEAFRILKEGRLPSLAEMLHYPTRSFSVSTTNDKNYITYASAFPKSFASRWEILILLPEEDLTAPLIDLREKAVVIVLVFMLLAVVIISFLTDLISIPIIQLAEETKKISNFNLDNVKQINSSIQEIDVMNKAVLSATKGLKTFKKYVPHSLVQQLIELGHEQKLGGVEKDLTIFFSDIANFTSISEKMAPEDLMTHLSEYLEELSNVIMDGHQGTIDKYIGDAIMAFWGAPIEQPNSPYMACKAALDCQKKLEQLNGQWTAAGKFPMETRIGIHSGPAIVGNLGSEYRMNYTIIGNSTNLASRLEGINKKYGTHIIISEDTYHKVSTQFFCRLLDCVSVKGQEKGYKIYELIAETDDEVHEDRKAFCKTYESGFQAYLKKDWEQALAIFNQLKSGYPDDKSVNLLIDRCHTFQTNPESLPGDWDGTYSLKEK